MDGIFEEDFYILLQNVFCKVALHYNFFVAAKLQRTL